MTEYETLAIAEMARANEIAVGAVVASGLLAIAAVLSAAGIWAGIVIMGRGNKDRAKEAMESRAALQAAIDALKTSVDALKDVIGRTDALEARFDRLEDDGGPKRRFGPAE